MDDKRLIITPKKYRGDTSIVSARLPSDLIKALDKISEKTGRNRNEIILLCLEYAIDHIEYDC